MQGREGAWKMHESDYMDIGTVTEFQRRVYEATGRVPPGYVTTYKRLAEQIGCGSPRAVGQALRRNPFAPRVPCHRVIASDLTLGGFKGARSGAAVREKRERLAREGVRFVRGRLADRRRLHDFLAQETFSSTYTPRCVC